MRFYRPLGPVRAMTFDLDDTLYNNEPVIRAAEQALQQHIARTHPHAARLTPADWQSIKRRHLQRNPRLMSDMGQLRRDVLNDALAADIADETTRSEAVQVCFDCFYDARSAFSLDRLVHDTLAALAASIPLVGITNGNVDAQKIGIDGYFQQIFHASLARPMKPHRHMFDEAVALLGIEAAHILHVGDNLEKDVYGAIAAGKQAAWFACNRTMDLRNENVQALPHVQLDCLSELTLLIS